MIDSAKVFPDIVEALLQIRPVHNGSEELFEALSLLFAQEREVFHILPGLKMNEEFIGLCHIFVNVVKVCQHQLSPGIEVIQAFHGACLLSVNVVETEDKRYLVRDFQVRMIAEQVADGDICGTP